MKLLADFKKRFYLLIFLSPFSWWIVVNLKYFISEWSNVFGYISAQLNSLLALYNLRFILDLRSGQTPDRLFFNKITLLLNAFLDFLSFLSPRFYFYEGATQLKGAFIEYIPLMLLPFYFIGVVRSIKLRKLGPFAILIFFLIFAFLTGQKNIIFLFPIAIVMLYFSNFGIAVINKKYQKIFWSVYFLYSVFLFIRFLLND